MKLHKQYLSAATLVITLIFVVTMISVGYAPDTVQNFLPSGGIITTSTSSWAEPETVGVGQSLSIQAIVRPPPARDLNITLRLTAPNGTYLYLDSATGKWSTNPLNVVTMHGTADFPQLEYFTVFKPDAVGIWNVLAIFNGLTTADVIYTASQGSPSRPTVVTAQQQPAPPTEIVTKGYVDAEPRKVATGQSIYIVGWVNPPREVSYGIYHVDYSFIITQPDGTTVKILKKPDSPATASFSYVCAQAGNYSVVLDFPGDVYPTFKFLPCTSPPTTFTAENDYVTPRYPEEPLPTGPWKYPINAEFQQWYQISGPWAESGATFDASQSQWNPATKGPNSAHVIWAKGFEGSMGGLMGGVTPVGGDTKAFTGSMPSFVAWQGKLWYATSERNQTTSTSLTATAIQPVVVCVDQFTGQELWRKKLPGTGTVSLKLELQPREKIDPGQAESIGVINNLWAIGSGLRLLSPTTGECSYYNSTFTPSMYYDHYFYASSTNSTDGETFWTKWSTTDRAEVWKIPTGREFRTGYFIDTTVDPPRLVELVVIYGMWPLSTRVKSWNLNTGAIMANGTDIPGFYATEGAPQRAVVGWGKIYYHCYDRAIWAVDTATGTLAWKSEPQSFPWGGFNAYNMARGYNLVYANGWDGYQYAYNASTGKLVWKAFSADSLGETAMGAYGWWGNTIVGDEKCYTATGQHTQPSPPARGDALYAVNALTGNQVWKLDNFQQAGGQSLASGVLTYGNAYDGRVYAFAQGPTETTITAVLTAVPEGSPVLLQGTVMDMSPGAPNTPAVSDDSQNQWMQYLYMNKPMPSNATGVVVHLEYIGADGSKNDLTHVTTDLLGHYEFLWTPPAQGAYKVIATMDSTNSYYASTAETAVGVGPAQVGPAAPEVAPDNTPMYFGISTAIIVAAIAIVGLLILRKRP